MGIGNGDIYKSWQGSTHEYSFGGVCLTYIKFRYYESGTDSFLRCVGFCIKRDHPVFKNPLIILDLDEKPQN